MASPAPPAATSPLAQALALHQQGRLADAAAGYRAVLATQPAQADALHLLGVVELQSGKPGDAIDWITRAIASDGRNPAFHNNLGIALEGVNRVEEAAASYGRAAGLNPSFAEGHYNLGNALDKLNQPQAALASLDRAIQCRPAYAEAHFSRAGVLRTLGQPEAAVESYGRAIAAKPDYADACYNRANTLRALGRNQEAVDDYRRAIELRPTFAAAWNNCGNALQSLQQLPDALHAFDQAIRLDPAYADAHNNRGSLLRELKDLPAAIESFRKVIALNPRHAVAWSNLGNALSEKGSFGESVESFDHAIGLQPDFAEPHGNRGNALRGMGRLQEALESYDKAITLRPDFSDPYCNRGNVLRDMGRLQEALDSYERAIVLNPDSANAHWNRSLGLLLAGVFSEGWKAYEWRWKNLALKKPVRTFSQPLWLGDQPVAGRTVLLHAEQGLGDTLQFCRYARLVKSLGARVLLQVQAPLQRLLAGLEGVDALFVDGQALPAFDFHCPLLSLPLAFNTGAGTIPADIPYLAAPAGKKEVWAQRLGAPAGPRVGLVWSGNPEHGNDRNRSIALAELIPHLPPGIEYISLQKDVRAEDNDTLASHPPIRRFDSEIADFSDTAALCELVDVLVSVDTSVAHLAGALGRPVWMALPFNPDWRWMLERNDSPWYPSATLYRQEASGHWDGVLSRLGQDLQQLPVGPR